MTSRGLPVALLAAMLVLFPAVGTPPAPHSAAADSPSAPSATASLSAPPASGTLSPFSHPETRMSNAPTPAGVTFTQTSIPVGLGPT
ncbi:MAG: hypothetical protein L3J73_03035, partial [Thermoplasmata archaeon]|nr:hypothetical protein [Thermoplasmata archaeon]